jgi:hypothetical protein
MQKEMNVRNYIEPPKLKLIFPEKLRESPDLVIIGLKE